MSLLLFLISFLAIFANASARKLLSEPKCDPLKKHLGVFGHHLLSELEKDPEASDLVKLINLSKYAEGSDRKTFFMPAGDRATKTLLSLTQGKLGPLTSPPGSSEYRREIRQIVKNHIASGDYPRILHDNIPTLAWESELIPHKKDGQVLLESCHTARKTEVTTVAKYDTCAGTVHIVDDIMTPHSVLCAAPSKQCGGENWQGPSCCAQTANTAYQCVHVPHNLKHASDPSYKRCQPVRDFRGPSFMVSKSGYMVPIIVKEESGSRTPDKADFMQGGHTTEATIDKAPVETSEETHPKQERIFVKIPEDKGASSGTLDEYITFRGIDYIPEQNKTNQQLILEDLKGEGAAVVVNSLKECADHCSTVDACNVASFYQIGSVYPAGRNCWLKNANFAASMLSSCKAPADASKNDDAVLIFLVDETCALEAKLQAQLHGPQAITTQSGGATTLSAEAAASTSRGAFTPSVGAAGFTNTVASPTETASGGTTATRSINTPSPTQTVAPDSSAASNGQRTELFTGGLIGLTLILFGL